MILQVNEWVYGKLAADSALTTALTGGAGIVFLYPNDFETLPVVAYSCQQMATMQDFWDDVTKANDVTVTIDVYGRNDQNLTPIIEAVDAVMTGLLFTMEYVEPVGDESAKTQHLAARYGRAGVIASDLV